MLLRSPGHPSRSTSVDLPKPVLVHYDYPTTESFAAALKSFGSMSTRADLLAAMSAGDEGMLLYDMDVPGLGTLRVAEHFAVQDGKIVRIRQIHDTAAMRAAGFVG